MESRTSAAAPTDATVDTAGEQMLPEYFTGAADNFPVFEEAEHPRICCNINPKLPLAFVLAGTYVEMGEDGELLDEVWQEADNLHAFATKAGVCSACTFAKAIKKEGDRDARPVRLFYSAAKKKRWMDLNREKVDMQGT